MPPENMRQITARVAAEHKVAVDVIMSPLRGDARTSRARQAAFAACRATGRYSLPKLGQFFGRDPATILTGVRAHTRRQAEKTGASA